MLIAARRSRHKAGAFLLALSVMVDLGMGLMLIFQGAFLFGRDNPGKDRCAVCATGLLPRKTNRRHASPYMLCTANGESHRARKQFPYARAPGRSHLPTSRRARSGSFSSLLSRTPGRP